MGQRICCIQQTSSRNHRRENKVARFSTRTRLHCHCTNLRWLYICGCWQSVWHFELNGKALAPSQAHAKAAAAPGKSKHGGALGETWLKQGPPHTVAHRLSSTFSIILPFFPSSSCENLTNFGHLHFCLPIDAFYWGELYATFRSKFVCWLVRHWFFHQRNLGQHGGFSLSQL